MLQRFFNNLRWTAVVTMECLTLNLFSIVSKQYNNNRNVVLKFELNMSRLQRLLIYKQHKEVENKWDYVKYNCAIFHKIKLHVRQKLCT